MTVRSRHWGFRDLGAAALLAVTLTSAAAATPGWRSDRAQAPYRHIAAAVEVDAAPDAPLAAMASEIVAGPPWVPAAAPRRADARTPADGGHGIPIGHRKIPADDEPPLPAG